jgi:hypothetical protein
MNARVLANTGMIRMIVDRLHVSVSDDEIVADFNRRLDHGDWNAHERRRVIQYALAVHHTNQQLYRTVMRGF